LMLVSVHLHAFAGGKIKRLGEFASMLHYLDQQLGSDRCGCCRAASADHRIG
jgi:hypothetical protein